MSDEAMREDVAKAIHDTVWNIPWGSGNAYGHYENVYRKQADAAIAAATPHIRRQVIEELAQMAEAEPFMDFTGDWERSSSQGFADWLRSKLEAK